ncbi:hypothetical protein C4F40_06765 [Sphingobacterium sp. Ka21]|uniref:Uncharacterized protein n=2 Tax=Sphingobacterium pedocola TaxID=2082722 RepID=A0ABR9T502_9SPHI|nr:hypothetical protein [Sphingobacterium pedocola]
MQVWQDSLVRLGNKIFRSPAEPERLDNNFKFVKTLVSALKEPNSYYYSFEQLNMIAILSSPDNNFKIFTWNVPLEDGSYLYYGAIQHKTANGQINLTPLLDKTFEINAVDSSILSNIEWYGAQYYDIVSLGKNRYVLLGWKGHHTEYTQKVIEILSLNGDDQVELGASVFLENSKLTRRIFSYTRQATMYLKYNGTYNRIEFDNLVPADPNLKGNFKYYGPDLSYDAYEVTKEGKLKLLVDVEVKNVERGNEDQYIDPTKPDKKRKSGFR